jgi:hypothetical protein
VQLVNIILFVVLLTAGGAVSFLPKKDTISEMENRKLTPFPQYADSVLWNGEYFKQLDLYYADNFPFRDKWMAASSFFKNNIGFESSEIKMYEAVNNAEANEKTDSSKAITQSGPLPDDSATGEIKKRVFVFKKRGYEIFGAGATMGKKYADVINTYNRLGIPNLQVYSLIIPVALEFEITEKYADLQKPNRPAIENIYNSLDSNIKKVWAIDEIRKHREEYIYFNTDHHWTSLGAYYAYRAFCDTAGLTAVSLDTIPSKTRPAFLGSLYRITRDEGLQTNPDSVRYYLFPDSVNFYMGGAKPGKWIKSKLYAEAASGGNSYSVFIQGDLPIVKIETQHKNGRKIALVKESYGNSFAPFLVNNYEKIIVVDQRYYTDDFLAMLQAEGINELLFINNIFAAHTDFHIQKIKAMMKPAAIKQE